VSRELPKLRGFGRPDSYGFSNGPVNPFVGVPRRIPWNR